ncbi:hypothetical protein ACFL5Z_21160 [Planctomycetota bacterium]
MMIKNNLGMLLVAVVFIALIFPVPVKAQFSRTPWEMNLGEGIVSFDDEAPYHGYEDEYDFATIPAESDPDWEPAPDQDIINYSQVPSTLCDGVMDCRWGGDFTYFRTYVDIPSGSTVDEFTISMSGVDDGVRVTIFNSSYPSGIVVPGSYVFLGGSGTADLKDLVEVGEINMVILTQVDDCCYHSYLSEASVVINDTIVENQPPVAVCQPAVAAVGEVPDIDGGSYDPDGDELTLDVSPAGFDVPGTYDATLTVTDPYGETDSCTAQVVVYDPSGDFVTGGGWFNQPDPIIPSFNDNYYELVEAPGISWTDADEEASAMTVGVMGEFSGHLVTITSQAEQVFLSGVFGSSLQEKWYGGFQDPDEPSPDANWKWVTGEPWDYENWAGGEPNDEDGVEDGKEQYLMGWSDELTWNDGELGTDWGGYVVEYEGSELLTDKATFGFVAKYKKGASVPTGQTEFMFSAGGLNFHSSTYDWLVVNEGGFNIQLKGSGTINGEGDYKFMLWAGDDDPDTFRIKIWEENSGEVVVYDNGFDQAIGGGSIVIHKGKN